MKLTPTERAIYIRGQHDGERGKPPMTTQYSGSERRLYERGYGRGYDARYRGDVGRKHASTKCSAWEQTR